ncbi:unnamed protein product [Pseudo-nitzschia multistriata]|uniref:RxLR effector protein n=1 Tax=Pseudo-nitzschia multistriata TaxID=183589 RepID=A0A448Z014_9STRA|nr:unnamed protein product [Pseudo-nitzschia multistriata]
MKFCASLLAAAVLVSSGESFLPVTTPTKHTSNNNKSIGSNRIDSNRNRNSINIIQRTNLPPLKSNNDDMVDAQEREARKICPLIPIPEDPTATFEAAMG